MFLDYDDVVSLGDRSGCAGQADGTWWCAGLGHLDLPKAVYEVEGLDDAIAVGADEPRNCAMRAGRSCAGLPPPR